VITAAQKTVASGVTHSTQQVLLFYNACTSSDTGIIIYLTATAEASGSAQMLQEQGSAPARQQNTHYTVTTPPPNNEACAVSPVRSKRSTHVLDMHHSKSAWKRSLHPAAAVVSAHKGCLNDTVVDSSNTDLTVMWCSASHHT
jgi:hypothetical protein